MTEQPGSLGLFAMFDAAEASRVCRDCGCTEDDPCIVQQDDFVGGCWWVEPDLYSGCADPARRVSGPQHDQRVPPAAGEEGRGDGE